MSNRALLALLCLSPAAAALPDVGDVDLVSVDSFGAQANFTSDYPAVSADGRFVAFQSGASNLVPGDTNFSNDIFVHDRETGATTRVSVTSNGGQANAGSERADISDDGRYVTFTSGATNLVANDFNGWEDVFLHDRATGTTTRISLGIGGQEVNAPCYNARLTGDAAYVVFVSTGSTLTPEPASGFQIYRRELASGINTLCSVDDFGAPANGACNWPVISEDGAVVAFESLASNLAAGDTNGATDVFVRDLAAGTTTRVSVATDGTQGNSTSEQAALSSDGSLVAFNSLATTLVPGDTNGWEDVFLHDRTTGATSLISADADGQIGNHISQDVSFAGDGTHVTFYSWASDLVAGDMNGMQDIFIRDLAAGTTTRVGLGLGGAEPDWHSYHPRFSRDSRFIAFMSDATNLVPGDANGWGDLFVVEVAPALPPVPSARGVFASSQSHVAIAPVQPGGAQSGLSAGATSALTVHAKAGLVPSGATLTSTSFVAHVATAALPAELTTAQPLVFGTAPFVGAQTGGETVAVHGFNLDDGLGSAAVELVGVPAAAVATTSNTVLSATSGAGVNVHGNPLGAGDVVATTTLGTAALERGFVYGPALDAACAPRVGQAWPLAVHLEAGDLFQVALGTSIPGVAVPVWPLDGAAEILVGIVQLTPLAPATSDLVTLPLPIPNNPALAGVQVELQAAVITNLSPLAGTFTNRLVAIVEP